MNSMRVSSMDDFGDYKAQEPNWQQLKAAGGNRWPQKMAPTQVTSSNRTVVAKMFWMLQPVAII